MKKLYFLTMLVLFAIGFTTSCSDDEDPIIIENQMILVDKAEGMFYAINTTNGDLTPLDSIVFNDTALVQIRDVVYNPSDSKIYITTNGSSGGRIYSANPLTLEASLINDNSDEDWDAIAEMVISNGKLLGTVYLNEPEYDHSLINLELNGTESTAYDFVVGSNEVDTDGGMGLAFGSDPNTLLVANEDFIYISNLTGNVSDTVELSKVGFQPMGMYSYSITSLEWDDNGNLFGLTSSGHFVRIDIEAETITLIDDISGTRNQYHGLTNIPENIF